MFKTLQFSLFYRTPCHQVFLPPRLKHKIKAKYTIAFILYSVPFILYFFVFQPQQLVPTIRRRSWHIYFVSAGLKKKIATTLIIIKTMYGNNLHIVWKRSVFASTVWTKRKHANQNFVIKWNHGQWTEYLRCTKQQRATMEFSGLPRGLKL